MIDNPTPLQRRIIRRYRVRWFFIGALYWYSSIPKGIAEASCRAFVNEMMEAREKRDERI